MLCPVAAAVAPDAEPSAVRLTRAVACDGQGLRWGSAAVVIAALLLSGSPVEAQRALSIRGRNDLSFGTVLRGVPTSIVAPSAQAGAWSIRGEPQSEVQIVLTLPANLINATGQTMPVTFGATDGAFDSHPQGTAAQSFDPRLPLVAVIERSGGQIYVFLGGTASPSNTQPSGTYVAPITLTVSYTGN